MKGAITGDIVGSYFEHFPTKRMDFKLLGDKSFFTDDTVLTVAVADWLVSGGDLRRYFYDYVDRYPGAGYGGTFIDWARCEKSEPYGSWGNGSAMRVSPVAYAAGSMDEALRLAEETAVVTHNHPSGILGALAVAGSVYVTRTGGNKQDVRDFIDREIGYNMTRSIDQIRPLHSFDVSCEGSVPPAIQAFLESDSFEHAVRLAVSLGGDADTMACIAGAIAEPFYGGVPEELWVKAERCLDQPLRQKVQACREALNCDRFVKPF